MPATMKKPSTLSPEARVEMKPDAITPEVANVKLANLPESPETEAETPETQQDSSQEEGEVAEAATAETQASDESPTLEAPAEAEAETNCPSDETNASDLGEEDADGLHSDVSSDLVSQLVNAKRNYRRAEADVESIKEDLKEAKATVESCARRVMKLIDEMEEECSPKPLPLFDRAKRLAPPNETNSGNSETIKASSETNSPTFDPDAWKTEPLSVLDQSEGITTKLLEKLAENNVDNLGDLEALRAEISNGKASWPKGVGEKKITALENAVVEWLARWNAIQQAAAANVSQGGQDGQDGDANSDAAFGEGYPSEEDWAAMHDETQISWLNARAVFLEEKAAVHPDGLMAGLENGNAEGTDRHWAAGTDAADEEELIANCDLSPGVECDAWIMGWLWQSKQIEDAMSDEGEGE